VVPRLGANVAALIRSFVGRPCFVRIPARRARDCVGQVMAAIWHATAGTIEPCNYHPRQSTRSRTEGLHMSQEMFRLCLWIAAALMAIVPIYLLFENNIVGAVVVAVPSFFILTAVASITGKWRQE
jgi:Flp pilus assembly protein TadB